MGGKGLGEGLSKGWLEAVSQAAKQRDIDIHAELARQALEQAQQANEEDLEDMRARVESIFTPTERQQAFLQSTAFETLFGGAAGGGKAGRCPDRAAPSYNAKMETKVLTPKGFRLFGDIRVGDAICNPDGTTCKVLQIHEQGVQQFYRVTLSDGSSVEASEGHLWAVSFAGARKRRKVAVGILPDGLRAEDAWNLNLMQRYRLMTTKDLHELLRQQATEPEGKRVYAPQLPLTAPVAFTSPPGRWPYLPPYLLGVLVGDGCLTHPRTVAFTTADRDMIERVRAELPQGMGLTETGKAGTEALNCRLTGQAEDGERPYVRAARDGLMGKGAGEKFIPPRIKRAPVEVRQAFMQGLFDADGYIDDRGHIEFVTISQQLAEDVQWVCRSFGLKATLSEKWPTYTHNGEKRQGQKAYRLYIRGLNQEMLFSLPRKVERAKRFNGGNVPPSHRIVSVEPTERDYARCITVDHPNHLYITDDFIVTHNSHALMGLALRRSVLPRHTSILFRETFRQINGADGLAQKSMQMYPHAGGTYNGSEHRWTFPVTGSQVYFAHLANRNAYLAQQGLAFQMVGFDELTHFSESDYLFLISRARSVVPGVTPIIRATANPGGPGHEWVLNRWRPWLDPEHPNPAKAGEVRWYLRRGDAEEEVPAGTKYARSRTFIPSLLTDNPYLMHDDEYMANLMSLPELEREQLLRGNWTIKISAGLFFQRGRFSVVGGVPTQERLVRVRYWDRAASEPSETYRDPDYTVGMMVALSLDTGLYYIEDVVRFRLGPGDTMTRLAETVRQDAVRYPLALQVLEVDPGQAGLVEQAVYQEKLRGANLHFNRVRTNKEERAKNAAVLVQEGRVAVLDREWRNDLMNELEDFPMGKHDDMVDSLSGAINWLIGQRPVEVEDYYI